MRTAKAIQSMWIGRCTVYHFADQTDPVTHKTTQVLTPIVTDEPCRVSYQREFTKPSKLVDGAAVVEQRIILFVRPDLDVPSGSVVEVTQRGHTIKYKRSAEPMIYTNHQEVWLELYEDNA